MPELIKRAYELTPNRFCRTEKEKCEFCELTKTGDMHCRLFANSINATFFYQCPYLPLRRMIAYVGN